MFRILVDSGANIPAELASRHQIAFARLHSSVTRSPFNKVFFMVFSSMVVAL